MNLPPSSYCQTLGIFWSHGSSAQLPVEKFVPHSVSNGMLGRSSQYHLKLSVGLHSINKVIAAEAPAELLLHVFNFILHCPYFCPKCVKQSSVFYNSVAYFTSTGYYMLNTCFVEKQRMAYFSSISLCFL